MIDLDSLGEKSAKDLCFQVAKREKQRRKERKLSRQELSERSGVTVASLRRFEETGEISFRSLVLLLKALGDTSALDDLFGQPSFKSIQEVIDAKNY